MMCRYWKDGAAGTLGHSEVRQCVLGAVTSAGLVLDDSRRALCMGPPLPPGITSEDERLVLGLQIPRDPTEVRMLLNLHLPEGLRIERAWIVADGGPEENPALYDEAVYDVIWRTTASDDFFARSAAFLRASEVKFTRLREKKSQDLNARALVRDVRLLACQDELVRLHLTLVVGPNGSLRPDEFFLAVGLEPTGIVRVHRLALLYSGWRPCGDRTPWWQRTPQFSVQS